MVGVWLSDERGDVKMVEFGWTLRRVSVFGVACARGLSADLSPVRPWRRHCFSRTSNIETAIKRSLTRGGSRHLLNVCILRMMLSDKAQIFTDRRHPSLREKPRLHNPSYVSTLFNT
jgi:hypothetical protein